MLILGLNAFHPDAAACALRDGRLVAAVAEERLGQRHKHIAGFPGRAIAAVLQMAGASVKDIDYIAIGNDSNANLSAKAKHVLRTPFKSARGVLTHFQRRSKMQSLQHLVADACGVPLADCRFQVQRVEHHLAHIASSFYSSDFERAAGFSYDAAGDFTSAMYARCEGNRIEILDRVFMPDSLGVFYTALCQFIGFDRFGEEYKVMGLGAYGEPRHLDLMRELLSFPPSALSPLPSALRPLPSGSQFRLHRDFFRPLGKNLEECTDPATGEITLPPLYSPALAQRLGAPRLRTAEISQREKDIAASVQAHFEEAVLASLRWLHTQVPVEHLVTAGGCALNGVCNSRIQTLKNNARGFHRFDSFRTRILFVLGALDLQPR